MNKITYEVIQNEHFIIKFLKKIFKCKTSQIEIFILEDNVINVFYNGIDIKLFK